MTSRTGVLFDVDGTLCDTNYLHTVAWSRALNDIGRPVPMPILHHHIGMGSDKFTEAVLGQHSDEASEAHSKHFKPMFGEVRAFPGAADLLRTIKARGAVVVLASSADDDQMEILRRAIDADDVLDDATSSADADKSKPDPDIFHAALDKAGLLPENCIVVGDTIWDVQAASKAGMSCIGVLTGGIPSEMLLEAGAVEVYDSVQDLLEELDESAIGKLLH